MNEDPILTDAQADLIVETGIEAIPRLIDEDPTCCLIADALELTRAEYLRVTVEAILVATVRAAREPDADPVTVALGAACYRRLARKYH